MQRLRYLGSLIFLLSLWACAEKSGSSEQVLIPTVTVACASTNCLVNANRVFYAYITSSGCSTFSNIDFGFQVSGSATISCNGTSGCSGSVSSWQDRSGTATKFSSGTYDICVFGDMNGNWAASPDIGDVKGVSSSVSFVASTPSQSVSGFSNIVLLQ